MKKELRIFVSIISGIVLFYLLSQIVDSIFPLFPNNGKLLTIINLLLPVIIVVGGSIWGAKIIYKEILPKSN